MAGNKNDKKKTKEYALDKFDVDVSESSSTKKTSKYPKPKNPLKRFAEAVFPQAADTAGDKARKIILLAAIAILIGTLAFLIYQLNGIKESGKKNDNIASAAGVPNSMSSSYSALDRIENPDPVIPTTAGNEEPEFIDLTPVVNTPLDINFDSLLSQNPDTRAWIKITDTLLNGAVLHTPNDFDYYIDHDFYGNYDEFTGAIFASDKNKFDGTDDNIILYGHKLNSGYGFGYVIHYVPNDASREPLAFYKVHPTILYQQVGGQSETYKIFAGILTNTEPQYGEVFEYMNKTQFSSAEDFNSYMTAIMDRSWFYTDVDLEYGDKILTLSTCYWPLGKNIPTRWVLFARKVRDGESEYVDTSVAERNWGAKLFDYYYQVVGGQWYGSNWDTSKLLS